MRSAEGMKQQFNAAVDLVERLPKPELVEGCCRSAGDFVAATFQGAAIFLSLTTRTLYSTLNYGGGKYDHTNRKPGKDKALQAS